MSKRHLRHRAALASALKFNGNHAFFVNVYQLNVAAICLEGCMIVLACIIFSQFAAAPPAIADDTMAAATIVWNYIGELVFNMLVLVGAIKMSDRLVRELMGLG